MIGNHGLVQIGLKRYIAPLAQPIIAQIAFQTFDHALHRRSTAHDRLELLAHRRVVGVYLREPLERDADPAPGGVAAITAGCALWTVLTDRPIVLIAGRLVDKSLVIVTSS